MYISFLITLIAGLSTLFGSLIIFLKKKDEIVYYSLSFSSGIMIGIILFDLIPTSYLLINNEYSFINTIFKIIIYMFIGILINIIINKLINTNNSLYRVGILSMIVLIIHNIPEGILTFITSNINIKLGIIMSLAIILHNIPEGILISIPIYYVTNSKTKAIFYTFISGISEFIGALISYLFIKEIDIYKLGYIYSLISGLMIYIIYEILNELKKYKNKSRVGYILGLIIMVLFNIIIK